MRMPARLFWMMVFFSASASEPINSRFRIDIDWKSLSKILHTKVIEYFMNQTFEGK